jgi:hypothetical protein
LSFNRSNIFDECTSGRHVVCTLRFHESLGWLAQKERNDYRMRMNVRKKAGVRLVLAVQKAWSHNGGKFVISNHEDGVLEVRVD